MNDHSFPADGDTGQISFEVSRSEDSGPALRRTAKSWQTLFSGDNHKLQDLHAANFLCARCPTTCGTGTEAFPNGMSAKEIMKTMLDNTAGSVQQTVEGFENDPSLS